MVVKKCLYCSRFFSDGDVSVSRADGIDVLLCKLCGLMSVAEIHDKPSAIYDGSYFCKSDGDSNIGYKDYYSQPVANVFGKYAFARLFHKDIGKHLDLGCADGKIVEIFSLYGFASRGLDISKDAIANGKDKGLNLAYSNLESFATLEKYDIITAFDLLEHIRSIKKVMTNIKKSMKNEGVFVFSTLSAKAGDGKDYWFNKSLEHFIYFDTSSLSYILEQEFGRDNFSIIEVSVNGANELWGICRKRPLSVSDIAVMDVIEKRSYFKKDAPASALLTAFYDQISEFQLSAQILGAIKNKLVYHDYVFCNFLNQYYQGKFDLAISQLRDGTQKMPLNPIFWQGISDVLAFTSQSKIVDLENQVFTLNAQLFSAQTKLTAIENSFTVRMLREIRHLPRRLVGYLGAILRQIKSFTRRVLSLLIPKPLKIIIKKYAQSFRNRLRDYRAQKIQHISNKKYPKKPVSVIVPYYKCKSTIEDTLDSLSRQTFSDFEVIIVDDGSPDGAFLDDIEKNYDVSLRIIHQKNAGVASARNNGIKRAIGKYIICLDADDKLAPTYIEKSLVVAEAYPRAGIITTNIRTFGASSETVFYSDGSPSELINNNFITTAALFRKEAWEKSDGYPSGVGYEDWAFWLHAAELGYWSKLIPEPLFLYRTAIRSRFTDERKKHQDNIVAVQSRYPQYVQKIQKFLTRRGNHYLVAQSTADTAFVNLDRADQYRVPANGLPHILIVIPWMTFGGAEALILSFTRALKDKYNITFMTWLQSDHQWEKRFAVVSPRIYHLANLFDSNGQMEAFVLNFIKTRGVDVVHLIHTNFMFGRLRQMKALPNAPKIIVTLFNDRVKEYFEGSIEEHSSIDVYSTDNLSTAEHFRRKLPKSSTIAVIPNGIDTVDTFNNVLYDSSRLKKKFNIGADDIVVSFIGRLSPEKNPDTFLSAAIKLAKTHDRLHFLVLGDGVMSDKIAKLASDAGDDRIHILGYQSNTAKYLNISDIFVLPSMIEGFPISVLEAMSMGVAPIGADVGAMREIITHKKDGYIIEDGAEDNIVSAIEKLLRSPRLLASMRREAYATAHKRFTLRVLSDNYDNLYKDALR